MREELFQYCVNGPQAQERIQIKNGSCLTEDGFHYFQWKSFLSHLGNGWKTPHEKIAQKLKEKCQVKFGHYIKIEGKAVSVCKVKQLHIDKIEYKPVEKEGSNY